MTTQLPFTYDLNNCITQAIYPSGRMVQYGYDAQGRVNQVQTKASSSSGSWTTLANGYAYEPFGPVKAMQLGNGLAVANDWGNDGRLAARRLTRASDSTNLSSLAYGYDPNDNIASITDLLNAGNSVYYGYYAADRLKTATLTTATPGASTETAKYTTGTNRLASIVNSAGTRTLAYDARGNLASERRPGAVGVTTAYDGYGRLTGYTRTDVGARTFVYNGRDDRVAATSNLGTRRFVYAADGRVMGEYGASASDVKAEFIWATPDAANDNASDGTGGYAPLAVATPGTTGTIQINWVHGNHLGVPLVTTDASGNAATTPNDYLAPGYPGQSRTLADLYYNRYREYDPTTGRYIQADPIGMDGGENDYLYAGANPGRWSDPWGLDPSVADVIKFGAEWWLQRQIRNAATREIPGVGEALALGDAIGGTIAVIRFLDSCPYANQTPTMLLEKKRKGRRRSGGIPCSSCGAIHGGVTGTTECPDCDGKRRRGYPVKGENPRPLK